jgi:transposase-like protein
MTSITLIENEAPLIPIKTDKAGRRRLSQEHKEALLDTFESSAMSGAQFAKKYGLVYATFASWVKKRRESRAGLEMGSPSPDFVELDLSGSERDTLIVELPHGARIKIGDSSQVQLAAALIKTLAR